MLGLSRQGVVRIAPTLKLGGVARPISCILLSCGVAIIFPSTVGISVRRIKYSARLSIYLASMRACEVTLALHPNISV